MYWKPLHFGPKNLGLQLPIEPNQAPLIEAKRDVIFKTILEQKVKIMINIQVSLIKITSYTTMRDNRDRYSIQVKYIWSSQYLYLSELLKSCISNVLYILTIATEEIHSAKSILLLYCFISYYFIVLNKLMP